MTHFRRHPRMNNKNIFVSKHESAETTPRKSGSNTLDIDTALKAPLSQSHQTLENDHKCRS